ncbi:uncharacterized protein LOC111612943 [Centruroides sculpturatus]|uniref:uncharacterized protein LOC111612943 n=2 Tax=Centruroides sculpturatus TaxID=218467 RepID=UPI000C6E45D2|nr:uncharacterized protein LOC111612943 [Centruroides sculpturatus]
MKIILPILLCLSVVLVPTYQKDCHTEQLNNCFMPTMVAASRNLIPVDQKALDKRCDMINKSYDCLNEYMERCVADIHSMIYGLAADHCDLITKEWCDKGSQFQKEFLKIAPCLSDAVKNTHRVCMKDLPNIINQFMGDDVESRIPAGCCYFMQFYDCFYEQVDKSCGRDAFPTVRKASDMMGMVMTHNFCSSYDPTSDECTELLSRNVTSPSPKYSYLARFTIAMLKHRN